MANQPTVCPSGLFSGDASFASSLLVATPVEHVYWSSVRIASRISFAIVAPTASSCSCSVSGNPESVPSSASFPTPSICEIPKTLVAWLAGSLQKSDEIVSCSNSQLVSTRPTKELVGSRESHRPSARGARAPAA